MEKIFVYGSLLKDFWNHDRVLKNRVRSIEKGTIQGELYHLPAGYPAITSGQNLIYGEICTLTHNKQEIPTDLVVLSAALESSQGTIDAAKTLGVPLTEDKFIKIVNVIANSPAEKAKLQSGDIIIKLNGEELFYDTVTAAARGLGVAKGTISRWVNKQRSYEGKYRMVEYV